jgi:hypothetical protein
MVVLRLHQEPPRNRGIALDSQERFISRGREVTYLVDPDRGGVGHVVMYWSAKDSYMTLEIAWRDRPFSDDLLREAKRVVDSLLRQQ